MDIDCCFKCNLILLIRPVCFEFNSQTAEDNAFQNHPISENHSKVQVAAEEEFSNLVTALKKSEINIIEIKDTLEPHTPDSIFPNNWFSTHPDGTLCLFPMLAPNRRLERKSYVLEKLYSDYEITKTLDFTNFESNGKFLEGTGSIVIDHRVKTAFACKSKRTDEEVLNEFCHKMNLKPVIFEATDKSGVQVYHTNVLMSIGEFFVIICLEAVIESDRKMLMDELRLLNKEIIEITLEQMENFCGNVLEVFNEKDKSFLVMSSRAYQALNSEQIEKLEAHANILHSDLKTIEENGGGSARCMMAEIYLKQI